MQSLKLPHSTPMVISSLLAVQMVKLNSST
jgi:hypothetical protein